MAALAGAIIPSLIGGIAGLFNKRPPALNGQQNTALNSLLPNLLGKVYQNPTIDPVQQQALFQQNAAGLTGANNAVTHALVSRGLGRSGLLGAGLMQNQNQSQANENNINLNLQNQAVQQRQMNIQDILGLLNVNATGGQSGAGAFSAGLAPILAFSIQNMLNNRSSLGAPGSGPVNSDTGFPPVIDT